METTKNILVPNHRKLSENEVSEVLNKYSIEDTTKLPKMKKTDAALTELDVEVGDVVEIMRTSFAGENNRYYRVVIE